ncbi:MAG: glycosyltransferase family 4 protein [Alphaproteobacteria bacterium]|nr:glycosyltransferase family 4 protein [Alphaproteobacteria bacterium]
MHTAEKEEKFLSKRISCVRTQVESWSAELSRILVPTRPTATRGAQRGNHILHVFPSFGMGGVPLRMARIINYFGIRLRHSVVALDQDFAAGANLAPHIDIARVSFHSTQYGFASTLINSAAVLWRLRPDLLITYNWGAIEWAMANRLLRMTRHIHIEAGFGKGEADHQLRRRVVFRRFALMRCDKLIVPSHTLEDLARQVWKLPPEQVLYIPNGVDVRRFDNPQRDAIPGFSRKSGELVVGTVAPLRPEKNIGRLLHAFAKLDRSKEVRLVIAGEGVERAGLTQLASVLGIADRVLFTGHLPPESVLGSFDIFAISSDTEQMPNALLEAMAASCAVVAVDVGDIRHILGEQNKEFVVERDDCTAFTRALEELLNNAARRHVLGQLNRQRAVESFSQERMFAGFSLILDQILSCLSKNDYLTPLA